MGLRHLPAQAFQANRGIVTDAIDRKQYGVAAHDQAGQPVAAILAPLAIEEFGGAADMFKKYTASVGP